MVAELNKRKPVLEMAERIKVEVTALVAVDEVLTRARMMGLEERGEKVLKLLWRNRIMRGIHLLARVFCDYSKIMAEKHFYTLTASLRAHGFVERL